MCEQGHLGTKTGPGEALWAEGIPSEWTVTPFPGWSKSQATERAQLGLEGSEATGSHHLLSGAGHQGPEQLGKGLGAQLSQRILIDSTREHLTRFKNGALSSALKLLPDLSSLENNLSLMRKPQGRQSCNSTACFRVRAALGAWVSLAWSLCSGLGEVVTKEGLGVLSPAVVRGSVLWVCREGQGEALGTGSLRLTGLCGLSLWGNEVRPGGSRPAGGSAGVVDESPRGIQQALPLALLCWGLASGQAGQQRAVQPVVEGRAQQEDEEAEDLQRVEGLPAQCQAQCPDDDGPQAVQHHASGGTHLLGDADARKVEEGDAADVAQQCQGDERLPAHLAEGVQGVLQHPSRVSAEGAGRNVVHGHQQQGQDHEAKEAWGEKGARPLSAGPRLPSSPATPSSWPPHEGLPLRTGAIPLIRSSQRPLNGLQLPPPR